MKIDNFRGGQTDISAKEEALLQSRTPQRGNLMSQLAWQNCTFHPETNFSKRGWRSKSPMGINTFKTAPRVARSRSVDGSIGTQYESHDLQEVRSSNHLSSLLLDLNRLTYGWT